jgi:membrane-bound serine protease (ClpP class)
MVRVRRAIAVVALLLGAAAMAAPTMGAGDHVARLRLSGVIDQVNAAYLEEGLATAADTNAAAVIIQVDSPGGELTSMDRMIKAILASPIPVITYVAPAGAQAASAATFVTLAGDVAAMAPNTTIGAASVVGGSGEDLGSTLYEKITNSNAAKITELARDHGRNETWAEEAVREAKSASASEAIGMTPPIVDLVAGSTSELLAAIDEGQRPDGYTMTFHGGPLPPLGSLPIRDLGMNFGQQFLHILSDPNIAFILFTVGFYGLIAEVFHPNFLSGIVGVIALVLAFIGSNSLPLNVGGLLLLLIAVGMFVLELNVTSYGLLTVGGIIAFLLGAFALYTGVSQEQVVSEISVSPWLLVLVLATTLIYFFGLIRALMGMRHRAAFADPTATLVGAGGVAQTLIAPTGIAYAGGETWSARSAKGEITAGSPLRVLRVEGLELIVEPEAGTGVAAADESAEAAKGNGPD